MVDTSTPDHPGLAPAPSAAERARQVWQTLKAGGARHTVARSLVIDVLAATAGHLSIAAVHHRVAALRPEINISTVHRTVGYLVSQGVAHVLPWPGEALYGLNERPHVHAVCRGCGDLSEIAAADLAGVVGEAKKASALDLDVTGLALFGRCPSCRPDPQLDGASVDAAWSPPE
ncbi:MAG: Fur family transcriptional regulator [Micromonosporaceae bacterium]